MKSYRRVTSRAAYVLCVLCALASQPALAQKITPGLWQTDSTLGTGTGKLQQALQQHLAAMGPQQRAKLDAMMARQGVAVSGNAISATMCITADMASKQHMPIEHAKGSCTYDQAAMAGNTLDYAFSCTNPQGSGVGSATFTSPTAYTSHARVTTSATGASETVNITSSGRWLADDCASVQPVVPPSAP